MACTSAARGGRALYAVIAVIGITYTVMHTIGLEYPVLRRSVLQTNAQQCPTFITQAEHNTSKVSDLLELSKVLPSLDSVPEAEAKSLWEALQAQRRARVRSVCDRLNLTQKYTHDVYRHLLVDETHKVLYCFVPKVACTSWKRMWFWLTDLLEDDEDIMKLPRKTVHGHLLPTAAHLSDEVRKEAMTTYRKFLFTRHPLDRLVSAYRDKLESEDLESNFDFHHEIGREIERLIRGEQTGGGHNITFPEFIRWVSKPRRQQLLESMKEDTVVAEDGVAVVDENSGGEGGPVEKVGGEGASDGGGKESIVEQEKRLEEAVSDNEDGKKNLGEQNGVEGKGGGEDKEGEGKGKEDKKTTEVKRSSGNSGRERKANDSTKRYEENKQGKGRRKRKVHNRNELPRWTAAQGNEHWRPILNLCAPCSIQYDVIGYYENLLKEVDYVLNWMGAGEFRGRFPSSDRPFQASQRHESYWSKLSSEERESFMKAYLADHLLFGYDFLS